MKGNYLILPSIVLGCVLLSACSLFESREPPDQTYQNCEILRQNILLNSVNNVPGHLNYTTDTARYYKEYERNDCQEKIDRNEEFLEDHPGE